MRFIGVSETRLPLLPQKLITTTRAREKSCTKMCAVERFNVRDIGND
jgi:hypothetical protein